MSPSQVLQILWRRGWIALLTFVTAVAVASAVLLFVPGRYDAVATASIDPGRSDPLTGSGGASPTLIGIAQGNLIALVQSERVALAVVKQLNLGADPGTQAEFQKSEAFGRIPIDNWIADQLLTSVQARFELGSNVLDIKYKSNSALRSATIANAFLAATIDEAIAMKAASADQIASWFGPQIDAIKKNLGAARAELQDYQVKASMLAPLSGGDSENSQLMAVTQDLSAAKTTLTTLQSRYASTSVDLSNDPSDPDLQLLANLKGKQANTESDIQLEKSMLGANNPKVIASLAIQKSLEKQIDEGTGKMREHLRQRIETTKAQIVTLEAARKVELQRMIDVQGRRDKLMELEREVAFKQEQVDQEEKAEAQAQLQSKLTFSDIVMLDKAVPPAQPAFPKPLIVLGVAIGAGLSLGLILALLAEALDRRVRHPEDLRFATSAEVLGVVPYRRVVAQRGNSRARRGVGSTGGEGGYRRGSVTR